MKQLYRNRAVGNTAVFTALRERFCISLSKQEMAMLCIISRGVPQGTAGPRQGIAGDAIHISGSFGYSQFVVNG